MFRFITILLMGLVGASYAEMNHPEHKFHTNKMLESEMHTGHMHMGRKFMLNYKYMGMEMGGIRAGTDSRTIKDVTANYMMAPLNMQTKMHMVGAMYGFKPKVTGMLMLSFLDKRMEMQKRNGTRITNSSKGFGDTKLKVKYAHIKTPHMVLASTVGVSLPTGSIDKKNSTGGQMAYSMQMGSGTYDLLLEEDYFMRLNPKWSIGAKADATIRTGKNDRAYKFGNKYGATAFVSRKLPKAFEVTANTEVNYAGRIKGKDTALTTTMMPGNNTNNYGGTKAFVGAEIAFKPISGNLKGHQISLGAKIPFYQNVKGTQLESDYVVMFNWRKMF